MIIILAEKNDLSARLVAKWITYYNHEVLFLSKDDIVTVRFINISEESFKLEINGKVLLSNEIEAVWFRKLKFTITNSMVHVRNRNLCHLEYRVNEYLNMENEVQADFINKILKSSCKCIGNNDCMYVNKLWQLKVAQKVGLSIPKTRIFCSKEAHSMNLKSNKYITKGIYESLIMNDGVISCGSGTELIDITEIMSSEYSASLFQENIIKKFELRVFYLFGETFGMCIYSQTNKKTIVDYRNYDQNNQNRMVPFLLPSKINIKIDKLMKGLDLQSGSIDFIVTSKNDFVFLEVNPVGQFGFVSYLCNFNIEKHIACQLINM